MPEVGVVGRDMEVEPGGVGCACWSIAGSR